MLSPAEFLSIKDILIENRIIPIAVFQQAHHAVQAAEVLLKYSFKLIEITFRTEAALQCIREIKKHFPEFVVGCGSVLSTDALDSAFAEGASFAVSPSLDLEIVRYALQKKIHFIPGVMTPTELHAALNAGVKIIKIFPVAPLGGINYLRTLVAPFRMYEFGMVPTGAVNDTNVRDYLSFPGVLACGMSYIIDGDLVEGGDLSMLEARVKRIRDIVAVEKQG